MVEIQSQILQNSLWLWGIQYTDDLLEDFVSDQETEERQDMDETDIVL